MEYVMFVVNALILTLVSAGFFLILRRPIKVLTAAPFMIGFCLLGTGLLVITDNVSALATMSPVYGAISAAISAAGVFGLLKIDRVREYLS